MRELSITRLQLSAPYTVVKEKKAWLFGSYSRGEQRPWSDVDILVQYDRKHPIGLMKIAGMKVDLEDLLHCEVDLVEDGMIRPYASKSISRDKRLKGYTKRHNQAL